MSTVIEKAPRVKQLNGSSRPHHQVPAFPFIAAPAAAISATILVRRLARRREAAAPVKPSVYWSFSFASGNKLEFKPTLAPRLGSVFVRGRRAPRRLFRR